MSNPFNIQDVAKSARMMQENMKSVQKTLEGSHYVGTAGSLNRYVKVTKTGGHRMQSINIDDNLRNDKNLEQYIVEADNDAEEQIHKDSQQKLIEVMKKLKNLEEWQGVLEDN